mmetsp:Transcript_18675/g.32393  ORF Transcript_18675/g.32393 Transcript_18675/m.32393 type:complete len:208 (-) Transcript_18675:1721-2344(-)
MLGMDATAVGMAGMMCGALVVQSTVRVGHFQRAEVLSVQGHLAAHLVQSSPRGSLEIGEIQACAQQHGSAGFLLRGWCCSFLAISLVFIVGVLGMHRGWARCSGDRRHQCRDGGHGEVRSGDFLALQVGRAGTVRGIPAAVAGAVLGGGGASCVVVAGIAPGVFLQIAECEAHGVGALPVCRHRRQACHVQLQMVHSCRGTEVKQLR